MALSPLHQRFVAEYLVDLNATQAAIRAGYSKRTARQQGYRVLKREDVQAAVTKGRGRLMERLEVTAERIMKERARLAFHDPRKFFRADGTLKTPHELDDDTAAAMAGVEVTEMSTGGIWVERPAEGENGQELEDGEPIREFRPMFTKKLKMVDKNPHLTALERTLGVYKQPEDGDRAPFSIHIHPYQPKTEPAK